MKSKLMFWLPALGLAIMLVSGLGLMASSPSTQATASIPFDFYVKDKKVTSGDYRVARSDTSQNVIWLNGEADHDNVITFVNIETQINSNEKPRLVFNKYGDRYFLVEIWNPLMHELWTISPSRAEKEAHKPAAGNQTSRIAQPTRVQIALNLPAGSGR